MRVTPPFFYVVSRFGSLGPQLFPMNASFAPGPVPERNIAMSIRSLLTVLAVPFLLSHCTSTEDGDGGGGGEGGDSGTPGSSGSAGAAVSGTGGTADGGRSSGGKGGAAMAGRATGGSATSGSGPGGSSSAGSAGTSSGEVGGSAGRPEGGQGGGVVAGAGGRSGAGGASGAGGRAQGGMAGTAGSAGGSGRGGAGGMAGGGTAGGGTSGGGGRGGAAGSGGAGGGGSGFTCNQSCGTGMMCCPNSALTTSCIPQTSAGCLAPDLTISASRAQQTAVVAYRNFQANHCALAEQCIGASGRRRLLRFETFTPNIGTADMRLGVPDTSNPVFEYSACHDHFHFKGYAEYDLLDSSGNIVATGHKQAFCLLDTERYVTSDSTVRRTPQYECDNQGISRGWGDSYTPDLDCQWVDVTDVAPGQYQLRIRINQSHTLLELRYDNNEAIVPVTIN